MIVTLALVTMAFLLVATYVMELWFGIAVVGWLGDRSVVHRDQSPGPYWFAMTAQTLVFVVVPVVYLTYR